MTRERQAWIDQLQSENAALLADIAERERRESDPFDVLYAPPETTPRLVVRDAGGSGLKYRRNDNALVQTTNYGDDDAANDLEFGADALAAPVSLNDLLKVIREVSAGIGTEMGQHERVLIARIEALERELEELKRSR